MQTENQIPESLRKQLKQYEGALLRTESLLSFSAAFSFMILSFLICFGSDRLWDTASWLRICIILVGISPFTYYIFKWSRQWIWRRRTVRDLAIQIQAHHRQLGDRLLGAIELADSDHYDENISEELQIAAVKKVAEQAAGLDFRQDIDRKLPARAVAAAILLISLGGILYYTAPAAFTNTLARWIHPMTSIQRFTFTQLEPMPTEKVVPVSEKFEIRCKLAPTSQWKPATLKYTLDNNVTETLSFNNQGEVILKFSGISKDSILHIKSGDAEASILLRPVQRPSLKALSAEINLPKYTQRPPVTQEVNGGTLSLLKGSKFVLKGEVSRNIITADATPPDEKEPIAATVQSANFATPEFTAAKSGKITLNWMDEYNLTPSDRYELRISVTEDQPPSIECPKLTPFTAILINESLKIELKAKDDYGIKMVDAEYYIESADGKKISTPKTETISLSAGNPSAKKLNSSFEFSPELMNIPEKTLIVLHGVTNDFYPNRTPSKSLAHRIYILSYAQHTKLIQERLDRIMSRMEDFIRREKESLAKNREINKLDDKKLNQQQTTDKITEQKIKELAESRELKQMIAEGMKMMKEALRNKKFPDKTIQEWSKFLEQMQSMSDQEMKDLLSGLRNAQNDQQRRKEIQKSIQAQEKMIAKMKQLLKKMDTSLKSLTVNNFVNRLRKEGKREKEIADNLKKMMKDIIGLSADDIPADLKKQYLQQVATHKDVTENAKEIKAELNAFFARTRVEKYKKAVDAMENDKMEDTLSQLKKNLDLNHSGNSITGAEKLHKDFNKWADIIAKSDNTHSSQGGGQGGGGQVNMEVLLSILRMIQEEQNIRDKTKALDQKKTHSEYKKQAAQVAQQQNGMYQLLLETQKKNSCPKVAQMLTNAGRAMKDAERMLLTPQTDLNTLAAESEVIERLSGAFQQSGKNNASQQGAMMLQMLKQMLMQQSGNGKGGQKPGQGSGGLSNMPNSRIAGPDFRKDEGERTVDHTTGSGTSTKLPEEYKTAIEAFYRKMRVQ